MQESYTFFKTPKLREPDEEVFDDPEADDGLLIVQEPKPRGNFGEETREALASNPATQPLDDNRSLENDGENTARTREEVVADTDTDTDTDTDMNGDTEEEVAQALAELRNAYDARKNPAAYINRIFTEKIANLDITLDGMLDENGRYRHSLRDDESPNLSFSESLSRSEASGLPETKGAISEDHPSEADQVNEISDFELDSVIKKVENSIETRHAIVAENIARVPENTTDRLSRQVVRDDSSSNITGAAKFEESIDFSGHTAELAQEELVQKEYKEVTAPSGNEFLKIPSYRHANREESSREKVTSHEEVPTPSEFSAQLTGEIPEEFFPNSTTKPQGANQGVVNDNYEAFPNVSTKDSLAIYYKLNAVAEELEACRLRNC